MSPFNGQNIMPDLCKVAPNENRCMSYLALIDLQGNSCGMM